MKKKKITPESEFIGKVRGMIDHLYPNIEEEMREEFIHENPHILKLAERKSDFRLGFHSWFLLKFEFPSGATAMEMADSFPMDFFNKDDKKIIKNFLNYKESLFEIIKISNDKKEYTLRDLSDNKEYLVKTIDLPAKLEVKELVQAILVKNLNEEYFFYGLVISFTIYEEKGFIKEILKEIKEETKARKIRAKEKIEWDIVK